jgi:hypothetical protein
MSDLRELISKGVTRDVTFMGSKVTIKKLTAAQVFEIQALVKENKDSEMNELDGFNLIVEIIKMSVTAAKDMTVEDFKEFPMDELNSLSGEIMKFSGMSPEKGK